MRLQGNTCGNWVDHHGQESIEALAKLGPSAIRVLRDQSRRHPVRGSSVTAACVRGRPWKSDGYTDRPADWTPSAICPWTAQHSGPQRSTAVHSGPQRSTALQDDTWRDEEETARTAANPQLAGRFRRWWQVVDSNHRRRSRRFYRPPSSYLSHMPLTCAYAFRDAVPGRRRPLCVRAPRVSGVAQPTDVGAHDHGRRGWERLCRPSSPGPCSASGVLRRRPLLGQSPR